ncbi:hypothetical protein FRC07_011854, partial [Ceratobasidium sp. 392]
SVSVTMDVMRLLVETEKINRKLGKKLEAARAAEDRLRGYIRDLQADAFNRAYVSPQNLYVNTIDARPPRSIRRAASFEVQTGATRAYPSDWPSRGTAMAPSVPTLHGQPSQNAQWTSTRLEPLQETAAEYSYDQDQSRGFTVFMETAQPPPQPTPVDQTGAARPAAPRPRHAVPKPRPALHAIQPDFANRCSFTASETREEYIHWRAELSQP